MRSSQNEALSNQDVSFRMSVLKGSTDGEVVYAESHSVTTSSAGLADLLIGDGGVISGTFSGINWGDDSYFLKVEVDPAGGTSYGYLGTTQLISVPYALYSANISSPTRKFTIQEEMGHPVDSALFEVKNRDGQTVFAVYPEGTRVYILDEQSKGIKGGFAVGGYRRGTKGTTNEYMRITPDSIRLYIDDSSTKGIKGGFAVGGYSRATKGITDHYLKIKPDSAQFLMVSDQPEDSFSSALSVTTKSRFGGIPGKSANLFNLTRDNYFIGHRAGESITFGSQNSFFGFENGANTTEGYGNIFIGESSGHLNTRGNFNLYVGYNSGFSNIDGFNNVCLGFAAGQDNTNGENNVYIVSDAGLHAPGNHNVYVGSGAGTNNILGSTNIFIGSGAGYWADSSVANIFIGSSSGFRNSGGVANVFLGNDTGFENLGGSENTFIGHGAGQANTTGNANVYLGTRSGANNLDGKDNIFIGFEAGMNETGNGKLYIDLFGNTSDNALIYGEFYNRTVRINNRLGIGMMANTYALEVAGDVAKSVAGDWNTTSDARIKTDVTEIENVCGQILALRPVRFRYTEEWMGRNPAIKDKVYFNFIAQEFREVFPQAVQTGGDVLGDGASGLLQLDSYPAQIVAIKAIQELIEENREQQEIIEQLQRDNGELMKLQRRVQLLEENLIAQGY